MTFGAQFHFESKEAEKRWLRNTVAKQATEIQRLWKRQTQDPSNERNQPTTVTWMPPDPSASRSSTSSSSSSSVLHPCCPFPASAVCYSCMFRAHASFPYVSWRVVVNLGDPSQDLIYTNVVQRLYSPIVGGPPYICMCQCLPCGGMGYPGLPPFGYDGQIWPGKCWICTDYPPGPS